MKPTKIFHAVIVLSFILGFGVVSIGANNNELVADKLSDSFKIKLSSAMHTDTLKLEPTGDEKEEYEIIILDPGFDSWFMRNKKSPSFYEQSYLENWNQRLVQQWNSLIGARLPGGCAPTMYIDYRNDVDYGLELNHKLFYYFWYVHEQCKLFHSRPGMWF